MIEGFFTKVTWCHIDWMPAKRSYRSVVCGIVDGVRRRAIVEYEKGRRLGSIKNYLVLTFDIEPGMIEVFKFPKPLG